MYTVIKFRPRLSEQMTGWESGSLKDCYKNRPRGYKTFFMLNSTEHEIILAHKCQNANICWHFNVYERKKIAF